MFILNYSGYSCRLLTPTMTLLTINTSSLDATRDQLNELSEDFGHHLRLENDFALIIDGQVSFFLYKLFYILRSVLYLMQIRLFY